VRPGIENEEECGEEATERSRMREPELSHFKSAFPILLQLANLTGVRKVSPTGTESGFVTWIIDAYGEYICV
jgi:hypothetical protein